MSIFRQTLTSEEHLPVEATASIIGRQILITRKPYEVMADIKILQTDPEVIPNGFTFTLLLNFTNRIDDASHEYDQKLNKIELWLTSIATNPQLAELIIRKLIVARRLSILLNRKLNNKTTEDLVPSARPSLAERFAVGANRATRNPEFINIPELLNQLKIYQYADEPLLTADDLRILFNGSTASIADLQNYKVGKVHIPIEFTYKRIQAQPNQLGSPAVAIEREIKMYEIFAKENLQTSCMLKGIVTVNEYSFEIFLGDRSLHPFDEQDTLLTENIGLIKPLFLELAKMHKARLVHNELNLKNINYKLADNGEVVVFIGLSSASNNPDLSPRAIVHDLAPLVTILVEKLNTEKESLTLGDVRYLLGCLNNYSLELVNLGTEYISAANTALNPLRSILTLMQTELIDTKRRK